MSEGVGRRVSRRGLLRAGAITAAALPVLGAGRVLADEKTVARQSAFRLVMPGLWKDGPALSVSVSTRQVYQGGAVMLRANYRPPVLARFMGRTYVLSDDVNGSVGFIGVGTDDPSGPANVTVEIVLVNGEPDYATIPLTVLPTQWTVDYINLPPDPGGPGDILNNPELITAELVRLQGIYSGVFPKLWSGTWVSPVPGAPVTGYFGEQRSFNGGPVGGHHGGTDYGVFEGTPVYSTNRGVVVLSEELYVRGNMVIVNHGGGVFSGYAHMSERAVAVGDPVERGQYLGDSGATGLVAGAHLHWEMAVGGVLVDGLRWLDGTQGF